MQEHPPDITARRIGKYEVIGELGHGGMAVVYRARDTHLLRDVAVKVLHPHLATDPESRRRFLREAQAAARLRHPNIVEVFDFSVETDRESFMVSELLEGPTLRKFAEEHPGMPAEIAAAIGIVLCDALTCAHSQGVIHRDVKPDNILLQTGGLLKLTDFGIAHVADSGMTVTGQVLGSPAHMAPEQIEGRHIDARADLFAAGTVLYVLGVGRLPFEASHPHALLRKILETEYPDPLRAAPVVGHRFARIIRKCLEREPDNRYASAADLRAALMEFVAESGWDSPEVQLKKYFEAPEKFAAAHRSMLLAKLPELGVHARRDAAIPDALGYFNRALALDPTNARVLSLVGGISRRRRIRKAIGAVGIVVVAALASAFGVVGLSRAFLRPHAPITANRPPVPVIVPVIEPTRVVTPAVVPVVAPHVDPPEVASLPPEVTVPSTRSAVPTTVARNGNSRATRTTTGGTGDAHPEHTTGQGSVARATTGAAAHVIAETRRVNVVFGPGRVVYSIDGGAMVEYGAGDSRNLSLPVGHHRFRLVSLDGSCDELQWSEDIQPGPDILLVRRNLREAGRCGRRVTPQTPPDSTAVVVP